MAFNFISVVFIISLFSLGYVTHFRTARGSALYYTRCLLLGACMLSYSIGAHVYFFITYHTKSSELLFAEGFALAFMVYAASKKLSLSKPQRDQQKGHLKGTDKQKKEAEEEAEEGDTA